MIDTFRPNNCELDKLVKQRQTSFYKLTLRYYHRSRTQIWAELAGLITYRG